MGNNKISPSQPIGIFDSGIGGLTVASAINKYLPNEQLIYFGDTAHLPYGDKAPGSIKHYSEKICEFLLENNCKMIVIACNTASSIAYEEVKKCAEGKASVVSVIDPTVEEVSKHNHLNKIGVIGTKATISSKVYDQRLTAVRSGISVVSMATPLLVPLIEESFINSNISEAVIQKYLANNHLDDIDVLILGCTHYPLIKEEIEQFYNGKTVVVDSADTMGAFIKNQLAAQGLISEKLINNHKFYVSDYTDSFEKNTHAFFGKEVHLEQLNIWN